MTSSLELLRTCVRHDMDGLCSAHDFAHIERVERIALIIAQREWGVDEIIVSAWSLCHEYFDEKFFSQEELTHRRATLPIVLEQCGFNLDARERIMFIAQNIGYGKSLERSMQFLYNKEFCIVEDADRLEAIGAIAIARTFAFWWKRDRPIYDPNILPAVLTDSASYHQGSPSSINHFSEKLLRLKDSLHTVSARSIAVSRHQFMQSFLDQFLLEWNLWDV